MNIQVEVGPGIEVDTFVGVDHERIEELIMGVNLGLDAEVDDEIESLLSELEETIRHARL